MAHSLQLPSDVACNPEADEAQIPLSPAPSPKIEPSQEVISNETASEWNEDLSKRGSVTWVQATICLIVVVIGAGIMALAQLPSQGGIVLSFVFMVVGALVIQESGMAMWRGVMAWNQAGQDGPIYSYDDFARAGWGQYGEIVVTISMNVYFIGVVSAYCDLTAQSLSDITGRSVPVRDFLLFLTPVLELLAQCPNMSMLAKLAPVGVAAAFAICISIIVKSAADIDHWSDWPAAQKSDLHKLWPESPLGMGVVIATLLGAFGCVANIPSILGEMRHPEHFPFALRTAIVIIFALYATVMGVGYWAYGDFIRPDIVASMSKSPASFNEAFDGRFEDWTGPKSPITNIVVNLLVIVKLLISMPVVLMAVFGSMQSFTYTKKHVPLGSLANKVARFLIVILCVGIAYLVPSFTDVFPLFMSITGPLLQTVFPLLIGSRVRRLVRAPRSPLPLVVTQALIMLISIFTMTAGFAGSVQNILEKSN